MINNFEEVITLITKLLRIQQNESIVLKNVLKSININLLKLICRMPRILISFILAACCQYLYAQEVQKLYSNEIPNSRNTEDYETQETGENGILLVRNVTRPTLTAYLPEPAKATGTAIIICPGGGYYLLAAGHEGEDVARVLAQRGVAAFVLKYRLPRDSTMVDKRIGPLQDTQRAIQIVRENAEDFGISPDRIGIMGFSAGGHLAATAGTLYSEPLINNPDGTSLRPDFMALVYPVISSNPDVRHDGSFRNLLGESPAEEDLERFSPDLQVTGDTPPAFFVHARDDGVKVENSRLMIKALQNNGIEVDSVIYESGGHGFGLVNPTSDVYWLNRLVLWVEQLFP